MELQHFSHDHPLILTDRAKDGHSGIICNGCLLPVSGDTYECKQCEFVLHKSCVELPKQIIHFFHSQHPLTLLSKSPYDEGLEFYCDYCAENMCGFTYHCSICKYDLDIKCVQLGQIVNYEGHQHSFMVLRPTSFTCDICKKNSNGMGYTCSTCQLQVHKHCASLPITDTIHTFNLPSTFPTVVEDFIELQHFSHDHPLILNDQAKDGHSGINCNGCLRPASGDTYECRQCEFILHKSCAELPKQIIHVFHPRHPLTLLSKSPYDEKVLIYCNNCGEFVWGFVYYCSICEYRFDMKCVQMGQIVNREGHEHSFMVFRPSSFTCDICEETSKGIDSYICSTCQLLVHKQCASLPISDSVHTFNLPSTFPTMVEDLQESRDAASGEDQAVSLEENDMLSTIQHFSHPCQLILTNDEPQNEETCDELEIEEICDEPQNAKICDACVRPISAPFYQCANCKFFLHPSCAQLPTTIRTILHPHPLTIRSISSCSLFQCSTCLKMCTGFGYKCKICNLFRIDARCASITTNTLKHDGHEHILSLDQKFSNSKCSACGGSCCYSKFSCKECEFNLDLRCASLPLTARLGWDEEKHPLKLTFVNVENTAKFYFCDLCEEVRNPDDWYYCCKECDRSAHTACLFGKYDIKFGCGTYDFPGLHDHGLKLLAEHSWHKCVCKSEGSTDNTDVVMECPTCDYHTHLNLADFLDEIEK